MSRPAAHSTGLKASTSRGGPTKGKPKKKEKKEEEQKPKSKGFEMPAFSIPQKVDPAEAERQKKKMMRRNKPPGEDLKKLKEICKSLKGKKILVQEFIGLIAPSTGDNGELLRFVLAENLNTFRNTSSKIYETMTQDISDVLTNEHIQLTESSNEKEQLYNDKIVRIMNEIYHLCPDFDFKRYYMEEGYLLRKFPLAPEIGSSEEEEALLRQEAYHRYQWLKSEGDRLKEENTRLQKRMAELKKQQRKELKLAEEREMQAEKEREELEEKQEQLEEKLEELNKSVEKALVETEDANTEKDFKIERKKPKNTGTLPKSRAKKKPAKQSWSEKTAADIQTNAAAEELKIESSKASIRSKASSKTSMKKRRPPPKAKETSPFHYSPIKTPPQGPPPPKEKSPFHYSPPKTPPEAASQQQKSPFHYSPPKSPPVASRSQQRSPFHYSPPKSPPRSARREESPPPERSLPRKKLETTTTVVEPQEPQQSQQSQQPQRQTSFRRGAAPRDTWGGFY